MPLSHTSAHIFSLRHAVVSGWAPGLALVMNLPTFSHSTRTPSQHDHPLLTKPCFPVLIDDPGKAAVRVLAEPFSNTGSPIIWGR